MTSLVLWVSIALVVALSEGSDDFDPSTLLPVAEVAEKFTDELTAIKTSTLNSAIARKVMAMDKKLQRSPPEVVIDHGPFLWDESMWGFCGPETCALGPGALELIAQHHDAHKGEVFEKGSTRTAVIASSHETDDVTVEELEEEQPISAEIVQRDSFVLGVEIGSGGFKTVYKATYNRREVAVAVISTKVKGGQFLTPEEFQSIEREIMINEEVHKQKIGVLPICSKFVMDILGYHVETVKNTFLLLFTTSEDKKRVFIVMEAGLGDLYHKPPPNLTSRKLVAQGTALQMLMGLQCVHEAGYIHKDIKALNYLRAKETHFIWVNDFGLTQKADNSWGELDVRAGTRGYVPSDYPSRSKGKYDMYALGVTFHAMGISTLLPAGLVTSMVTSSVSSRPTVMEAIKLIAKDVLSADKVTVDELSQKYDELTEAVAKAETVAAEELAKYQRLERDITVAPRLRSELQSVASELQRVKLTLNSLTDQESKLQTLVLDSKGEVVRLETIARTLTEQADRAQRFLTQTSRSADEAQMALRAAEDELARAQALQTDDRLLLVKVVMGRRPNTVFQRVKKAAVADALTKISVTRKKVDALQSSLATAREEARLATASLSRVPARQTIMAKKALYESHAQKLAEVQASIARTAEIVRSTTAAHEKKLADLNRVQQLQKELERTAQALENAEAARTKKRSDLQAIKDLLDRAKASYDALFACLTMADTPDKMLEKMMKGRKL